jgi:hypothetical protein
MNAAPTNEPGPATPGAESADDPWRVPVGRPASAPVRKAPARVPGLIPGKAGNQALAKQARIQRAEQAYARLSRQMTWQMAFRWTLAGAVSRVLAACALITLSLDYAHVHSLLASKPTLDQWDSAVRTASSLSALSWLVVFAMWVPSQAWVRTRAYVAKLPGVAPHPSQKSNELYRRMGLPALWPPAPEGAASWTRRVHRRVPSTIDLAFVLLLFPGSFIERSLATGPGRYAVFSVSDLVIAALALLGAAFDLVRLRAYSRWPGRP